MVHITALAFFRPAPPGFPGATLQLWHSKHFLIPGNHHASVRNFKLGPDSERPMKC